jgi:hypothetical protein
VAAIALGSEPTRHRRQAQLSRVFSPTVRYLPNYPQNPLLTAARLDETRAPAVRH